MTILVRRATPGDAAALVELARAVGAEPEGWLITNGEWRTQSEERRYLRAVRRHTHAAVFVAETADGIVGRISLARDAHPASEHVADLGLMVAGPVAEPVTYSLLWAAGIMAVFAPLSMWAFRRRV